MITSIIYGKCSYPTYIAISEHFLTNRNQDYIRVAIPKIYQISIDIPHWDCIAKTCCNKFLAQHKVLKHLELNTHDNLLDQGLALEELLK